MAYEYDLRRLFRPQIDRLPALEQIPFYHQRDMTTSHLYRVGTSLFGGNGIVSRRRLIDSSLYSSTAQTPHTALLHKTMDGRSHPPSGYKSPVHSRDNAYHNTTTLLTPTLYKSEKDLQFTKSDYFKWIMDRKRLRDSMEGSDALKWWLVCKEKTPMEVSTLAKLTSIDATKDSDIVESKITVEEKVKLDEQVKTQKHNKTPKIQCKRQVVKEIAQLEHHLITHRPHFVRMLMSADKLGNRRISINDLLTILTKMRIQLSQLTVEILSHILEIEGGFLRYDHLLQMDIQSKVKRHFQKCEAEHLLIHDKCTVAADGKTSSEVAKLEKQKLQATLDGKNGILAEEYREAELKQFTLLVDFCKGKQIMLDWKLAEKALLLPPDHTKKECLAGLRQPGLDLLSSSFVEPPSQEREKPETNIHTYDGWGWPYKRLRGRKKAEYIKLFTGKVKIQPKTDCWLTFRDYLKLTEHIRSRPGFKYSDHGLPNNHAFWPGVMLDKLRLWLPNETQFDKPYSLYNIFQPVKHSEGYNPLVEQKITWPVNESGYVQLGSQNKKVLQS